MGLVGMGAYSGRVVSAATVRPSAPALLLTRGSCSRAVAAIQESATPTWCLLRPGPPNRGSWRHNGVQGRRAMARQGPTRFSARGTFCAYNRGARFVRTDTDFVGVGRCVAHATSD